MEHVSPRIKPDNHANTAQAGYSFQSNWAVSGCVEMPEVGVRKVDGYENNMVLDPSQGGDILLIYIYIYIYILKVGSFSFLPLDY
jgi:activating signal cointegrator complex subunit 2